MPFINGQWVDQGDFNFLGKYREGYDTAQNREAKKEAQVVYRAGDPRRAAEVLMPYDPEKANVYATEANRRAGVAYGRAYAGRNYDEARRIAQQEGNPQWAEQADRGERIQQFRDVSDTVEWVTGELANVSQLPKEQRPEAWKNLWYRAAAKSRNNPQWIAGIARIRQQFPEYSPEAAQALNGIVMQAAQAYASGDPEAYMQNVIRTTEAERDRRKLELQERAQDTRDNVAAAQIERLGRLGDGGGNRPRWRSMTPDEIQAAGLPIGTVALYDDNSGNVKTVRSKSQYTEFAGKAAEFANRMAGASPSLVAIESSPGFDPTRAWNPALAESDNTAKNYRVAMREWLAAILRKDTGAAVTDQELATYGKTYFPVPGDGPQQIAAKRAARERAFNGVRAASQGAYEEWFGGQSAQTSSGPGQPSSGNNADPLGIR